MTTNVNGNADQEGIAIKDNSFLIEEYKTIRDEIKDTKSRLFMINSIGISAIPCLLSWLLLNRYDNQSIVLMLFEVFIPILIIAGLLVFLSENRNLMRCGRYIRKCIEPSLIDKKKHPLHTGWEKWLEKKEGSDNETEDIFQSKSIDFIDKLLKIKKILNKDHFDKRAVDRLVVKAFIIVFIGYYIAASLLAIISAGCSICTSLIGIGCTVEKAFLCSIPLVFVLFILYFFLGRLTTKYAMAHYNDLISTKIYDSKNILSYDIGGTNSRFLLLNGKGDDEYKVVASEGKEVINIKTGEVDSLLELLEKTKAKENKCDKIVLAVPGPVTSVNIIDLPYVRWSRKSIDKSEIEKEYRNAVFINDFVAQAYGCLTEATKEAVFIVGKEIDEKQRKKGDIAIVGAGTGTGHCALKKTGDDYVCIPSEAGHIPFSFCFKDEEEKEFRRFLVEEKGIKIPVCNDIISGMGLSLLHEFFTGRELSASEVIAEIQSDCHNSEKIKKYFAKFYGRACRNYALSVLASGGILYISGGVAVKNPFLVNNESFRVEFQQGETNAAKYLLNQISVYLVRNKDIGLFGAAYYGAYIA